MKFLLAGINAKYIHLNPAIYSLRAYAGEKYRKYVELAEYTINNRKEEILADLYKRKPDAIGFSCYIWNFNIVRELLEDLPKVLPDTDIWLGGPEVSFEGVELFTAYPMVTGIMTGEGEATFRELLEYYCGGHAKGRKLSQISGLLLKEGYTSEREMMDMDKLPFLYDDPETFKNKIIYYESARGCPFRCSYCLSSIDKTVRLRSMDKVKKELQFFLDRKVPQVKFIDRTFNCNHEHAMEIWRYLIDNDNGVTNFHFEIAADIMTEEEIRLLKTMRPGLVQLEIGVQSTNEKTLHEINRYANTAHIAEVVKELLEKGNIHIHLDLIAGLPFEDYDSFVTSFNEVYAMKPKQLQLGFLKVLKGSPIAKRAEEYGIVCQEKPPYEVLYTDWLSYEEVLRLKRVEEMVEVYYNSNQFDQTVLVLSEQFEGPFAMFEALAEYYEKKGYFINTPARSYRYQALLEFAGETDPERKELYEELLTYDFYLRENAKSRPSFCRDLSVYHERIWEFYRKEEKEPVFLPGYAQYHARQTMKMTHMEVFYYPVWEKDPGQICQRREEPYFVLFDYQVRDPLTQDCKTAVV